jgi:hypothetical protein
MKINFFKQLVSFSIVLFLGPLSQAANLSGGGPWGLGAVLGSPTAITGKYEISNKNAVDFGLSFFSSYGVLVYGDYLWNFPGRLGHENKFISDLVPYFGFGGGLYSWSSGTRYSDRPWGWRTNDSSGMGLYGRIPLGVEWFPKDPPLGVFVELAPGLSLLPGMWVTFDIGVGVRYFF